MLLCLAMLYMSIGGKSRNGNNTLVAGLILGCAIASGSCATQCLLNLVSYRLSISNIMACEVEAYMCCCGVMMQFLSVISIWYRGYHAITRRGAIFPISSIWIIIANFGMAVIISFAIGGTSEAIVAPSGGYCTYGFTSPVIVFWYAPMVLLTLAAIAGRQFAIMPHLSENHRDIFFRMSFLYVLAFTLSWLPLPIASYRALTHDRKVTSTLDILMKVCELLHSIIVPVIYYRYHRIRPAITRHIAVTTKTSPTIEVVSMNRA